MSRARRVVLVLGVLLLLAAVAATFVPTGRLQDTCGPWVAPDPGRAVVEYQRAVERATEELAAEEPDTQILVARVPDEEIEALCSTEHEQRAALTGVLAMLAVACVAWVGWTRRRNARPQRV